jgi:dienelactone hydrolase
VPGYLWLPARRDGERFPAVLVLYGIKGDKNSGDVASAAEALNANGIAAMTIDWPGTGDRGSIGNQQRITSRDVLTWTVADYGAAVSFLESQPEVDGRRIAYVGASMGAMTGSVFAATDRRVKAFVAIVPIPNPLWGGDNPQTRIRQIAPRPVLCIYAANNADMSANVCNGSGGRTHALPGGHELEGFKGDVVQKTKAFLIKHLR